MTQPLGDGTTRLGLQISTLTLALHSGVGSTRVQLFPLTGRSAGQVRLWLGEQVDALGFDAQALDTPPPYEIPAHAIARGAPYDAAGLADALAELAAWYANAQVSLDRAHRQIVAQKLVASPVRCWPHHFDLATQATLPTQNADTTGYIGAGFSPGDEYYDEPYFYVSMYPEPDPAILPLLPAAGHWHTHEFTAAVKPARTIQAAKGKAAETDEFLQSAVAAVLELLGNSPNR
jgi:hypothetical protein